jgi:hypothetical protein
VKKSRSRVRKGGGFDEDDQDGKSKYYTDSDVGCEASGDVGIYSISCRQSYRPDNTILTTKLHQMHPKTLKTSMWSWVLLGEVW